MKPKTYLLVSGVLRRQPADQGEARAALVAGLAGNMIATLCVTFGVLVYALVIPWLEINQSHVFNASWPPHARLHEVWQLSTHCALGALALWLAWWRCELRIASMINAVVMGGVLVAHALAPSYGGSVHSGNLETMVLGMPLAVFVASLVVALALLALLLAGRPLAVAPVSRQPVAE